MITTQAQFNLSSRNTFRMKVNCALWVEVTEEEDLLQLDWSALPQPLLVMGGGSNLLFTGDFPGTVLHYAGGTAFGGTPFASLSPAPPISFGNGPLPLPMCGGAHVLRRQCLRHTDHMQCRHRLRRFLRMGGL